MCGKMFVRVLLLVAVMSGINAQDRSILEIIKGNPDLTEFARILDMEGLHRAFLDRQVTLFAPNNQALKPFRGKRNENLILNHITNAALHSDQLPEKLTTLVTGNPPLWVMRERGGTIYINEAKIIQRDISARSRRGDEQILHIIDAVLEPLVPISVRDAQYFVDLDAKKLLEKSSLYDLAGLRVRVFNDQAELNRKVHMFGVPGQHTFFMPVDSGFDVSVQISSHDHDRSRLRTDTSRTGAASQAAIHTGKVRKELVDGRVLESHIVPHRLMFTSHAPTPEFPSVAWISDGIQVNVSLQTSGQLEEDLVLAKDPEDVHPRGSAYDDRRDVYISPEDNVVVRSNTIVGDLIHSRGMVVARIVHGNIPVQNGVVHLIDKPLMIVARSLYEYILEEGRDPANRLSKFSRLLRDKGGAFVEALLEARDGTLLAPSNEALEKVDMNRLDFILGNTYLRPEMLGLHFVRERIISTEYKIRASGEHVYSTPASLATNRVWFYYSKRNQIMSVEGRGVNATVIEKDIGTTNGVIHVIDKVLGVPDQTVWERLNSDPKMSHMASLISQLRMDELLDENPNRSSRRFTLVVPSNGAWERAQTDFSKAYNTIIEGQFPQYTQVIIQRHLKLGERPLTFEELIEMSLQSPRQTVSFAAAQLMFTEQGEFEALHAYKDYYVTWKEVNSKVIRPNIECTNGIIHLVDKVFIDETPPWLTTADSAGSPAAKKAGALLAMCVVFAMAMVGRS